jgi:hypothetical protein
MNYFEAHKILDKVRDNLSYNLDTINKALELTGDLDIGELERETSPASYRYGSQAWLDSLCQGKGAGA